MHKQVKVVERGMLKPELLVKLFYAVAVGYT